MSSSKFIKDKSVFNVETPERYKLKVFMCDTLLLDSPANNHFSSKKGNNIFIS